MNSEPLGSIQSYLEAVNRRRKFFRGHRTLMQKVNRHQSLDSLLTDVLTEMHYSLRRLLLRSPHLGLTASGLVTCLEQLPADSGAILQLFQAYPSLVARSPHELSSWMADWHATFVAAVELHGFRHQPASVQQ